ncbi:MAG: hypothetical protein HY423_05670 [Candidatus Lambdaproteobacteria bacterium]|nr:hypothetical protein [Candidatus Lambdaproteobacteria bacterium]
MTRTCFQCNKPLPIERRHSVFCSLRCEQLHTHLGGAAPSAPGSAADAPPDAMAAPAPGSAPPLTVASPVPPRPPAQKLAPRLKVKPRKT